MHCNRCCDNHRETDESKTYSVSITAAGDTSFTFAFNCPCECHDICDGCEDCQDGCSC